MTSLRACCYGKYACSSTTAAELEQPKAIQHRWEPSKKSHCEGPFWFKGKEQDPCEWENVQLNENKIDAALQQAALKSYKEHGQQKNKHEPNPEQWEYSQRWTRLPESWPVAQIALDSFLGVALKNLEKQRGDSSDDPTLSSPSDDSESGESPSDTLSNSSRFGGKQHCWQSHIRTKTRVGRNTLKLIPPKIYDRSANARLYHWFIWESKLYHQNRKVRGTWWKVFMLSHFLKGKAYNFYTQNVAIDEQECSCPASSKSYLIIAFL
jgi:hypothetical protein